MEEKLFKLKRKFYEKFKSLAKKKQNLNEENETLQNFMMKKRKQNEMTKNLTIL